MRVVFIGAIRFSYHCLRVLQGAGAEVVGIVTLDAESARSNSDYCDLGPLAAEAGIPILRVRRIGDPATLTAIREMRPDAIFVFGFSQLLPPGLLEMAPRGCIGSHPALLPRNRGRHPLIWALVEGLTESGLTFFHLDEGVDSGDILWQKAFVIDIEDDAATLYDKIESLATEGINEFLPLLVDGTAVATPQNGSQASYWRKRGEADGVVHWEDPSMSIYNLIRALTKPYVGAHSWFRGERITLWRAAAPFADTRLGEPGTVLDVTSEVVRVVTGDGSIRITDLRYSDGRPLRLRTGDRLGIQ